MNVSIRLGLACLLSCAVTAHAQQNDVAATEQLLKAYGDSWAIKDPKERRAKLQKIWVVDGSHESPLGLSNGIEALDKEIGNFVKTYPTAKIQFTNIQRTGKNILTKFTAQNPDGSIIFQGVDYIEVNEGGQLKRVVGFIQQGS